MELKDWVILVLGVGCALGATYYVKHNADIEEIEGSVLNPTDSSFEPIG